MNHRVYSSATLIASLCVAGAASGQAVTTDDSAAKTLRLLKPPETPADYWDAVKFSINVGRGEDAASFLDRFLESNPSDDLLVTIRDRDGRFFNKLAVVPETTEKGRVLLARAEAAAREFARRPDRIQKFIGYLTRSPEHRAYAISQLRNAGADAVPYLLAALRDPALVADRGTVLIAMEQLTAAALPPLEAALAASENEVLADVIHVIAKLGDRNSVPHLRFVAEASDVPGALQTAAREAVSQILNTPYADLPAAPDAIVAEAERYYQHQVRLRESAPDVVRLWRWVPREGLKDQPVSRSYAEEYFGLGHCRQALALDPDYEPAQILMLSIALDKEFERIGIDQSLPQGPGRVSAQALAAGPDVATKVLARAMRDGRPAVALGALTILAETGTEAMFAASPGRPSPVVLALTSPDQRLQFAAAETALRLRPQKPFAGSSLLVPILARALSSGGAPRAIVIDPNTTRGSALASLVQEFKYEVDSIPNVRDAFAIATETAGVQLILIDPSVRDLELNYALAQLRNDVRTAGVPIAVLGERLDDEHLAKFERHYPRVKYFLRPATADTLKLQLEPFLASMRSVPLTSAERTDQVRRAAAWLAAIARGEIPALDLRPAERALVAQADNPLIAAEVMIALGQLASARAQQALTQLVLNERAEVTLRLNATRQLANSLRRFGPMLESGAVAGLIELTNRTTDPALYQALAASVGSLRPSSREAGTRIGGYRTPVYDPAARSPEKAATAVGATDSVPNAPVANDDATATKP